MQNRLSGLLFAGFGLALLFVVIPWQTETVGHGWMRPQTIPDLTAVVIAVSGLMLALLPRGDVPATAGEAVRGLAYLALVAAGLWAIARIGFGIAAPVLALVLMLATGERRPLWLAVGVAGVPVLIWLVVAFGLGRPLP